MKTKLIVLTLATATFVLCGCSHDGDDVVGSSKYITVTTAIDSRVATATDGSQTFEQGDNISLYAWTGSATEVPATRAVDNVVNTYDGTRWTPIKPMQWQDMSSLHYFVGIYPSRAVSDFTADAYTLDVTDQTAADLLVATNLGGLQASRTPVVLAFDHVMARMTVNLTYSLDFVTAPTTATVAATACTTATVNYLQKAVTATGTATAVTLPTVVAATSYASVMVPQTISALEITAAGKLYTFAPAGGISLRGGKNTVVNLRVGLDRITAGDITINNWTNTAVSAEANRVIINNTALVAILGAAPYNVPVASDGYIHPNLPATKAALDKITQLNVGSKGLTSLAGIEYLPNLTLLSCSGNQLTTLDVTKNTALQTLFCGTNSLTTLDVTKNTALQTLNCGTNSLTTLDVTKNTALQTLYCDTNSLQALDVTKNTALQTLNCGHNQLTTLDVTKNTALQTLGCFENQLTTLDVTKNPGLQQLACFSNQLTALNVTKNTALKHLLCYLNPLTTLDVTKNTALQYLDCSRNALTVLDVTKNTALQYLACLGNSLTTLDLTKNTALQQLVCYGNSLTTLDVTKNTALQELACFSNQLTALDVTKNTALQYLACSRNALTVLDVTTNTALQKLYCHGNSLTTLDVTKNTALQELDCFSNHLTALDITKNPALQTLWCNSQTTAGGGVQNLVLSWTQAQSTQSGLLQGTTGVTTQIVP